MIVVGFYVWHAVLHKAWHWRSQSVSKRKGIGMKSFQRSHILAEESFLS